MRAVHREALRALATAAVVVLLFPLALRRWGRWDPKDIGTAALARRAERE